MVAMFSLLMSFPFTPPQESETGTYVFQVAGQEVGRETVTWDANGWTSEGFYDVLDTRRGKFTCSVRHDENGLAWKLDMEDDGQTVVQDATYKDGAFRASLQAGGHDVEFDKSLEGPLFCYADLIWSSFIDLGRFAMPRIRSGELESGFEMKALLPGGVPVDILLTEITPGEGDEPTDIALLFAGAVEFQLRFRPDGIPLQISIPGQLTEIVLEGVDAVGSGGRTALDTGDWRSLLSRRDHEVIVETDVMIPMRDGVRLQADIYRPAGDGQYPAILSRTPYNRKTEGLQRGHSMARYGYAVIVQDVRGRVGSEGEWYPFRYDTVDGSDTIDWIAAQSWCTGNVGMIGASYVGVAQWYAARSINPHLKAIVPQVSPPDPDENFPYEGGVFLLGAAWWSKVLDTVRDGGDIDAIEFDFTKALTTLPLGQLDTAMGSDHPFLDDWVRHGPLDPFWDEFRYQPAMKDMTVAVLNISGWYDGDQPGALQNYALMKQVGREDYRDHQYLIMGPWGHAFNLVRQLGDVDFGREAIIDMDAVVIRFFDHYLKGIENGVTNEPPVSRFVMGENQWHRGTSWPPRDMQLVPLYMNSEGAARKVMDRATLSLEPPQDSEVPHDTYRYDPHNARVFEVDHMDFLGSSSTQDLSKEEDRDDDLEYISPPLAAPIEVTGPVTAVLSVSTDAEDTDFAVEVVRIEKSGPVRRLALGIQRLRYRNKKDEPVPPGTIVEIRVDCWATSQWFEAGDRIGVRVSSCLLPHYSRNMNTLESPATAQQGVVAENHVHHSGDNLSHLLLPIVPRDGAASVQFGDDPR